MDTLAVKPRENSRRGSAVKTLVVEANPNLQSPLLPLAFGRTFPVRKVNKDGRSLRTCQEARTREKTSCPAEAAPIYSQIELGFPEDSVREICCDRHAETLTLVRFDHANNPED